MAIIIKISTVYDQTKVMVTIGVLKTITIKPSPSLKLAKNILYPFTITVQKRRTIVGVGSKNLL